MQKFKKNRKKEYESTKVSLFMNTCNQPLSPNSEFNSLFHIFNLIYIFRFKIQFLSIGYFEDKYGNELGKIKQN